MNKSPTKPAGEEVRQQLVERANEVLRAHGIPVPGDPGRPTTYSTELGQIICDWVAQGRSLVRLCKQEGMPARRTVMQWLERHEEFAHKYAQAKQEGMDAMFEEMLEIADDGTNDVIDADGKLIVQKDVVARSKLRVDTRKWALARLAPRKYGDRVITEVTGADGGPIRSETNVVDVEALRAKAVALARKRRDAED